MKHNKKKTRKQLLIIVLICVPTAMLFGFLISNGKAAGPYEIPPSPENPRNEWTWDVSEGDKLIYDLEMKITDNETQEIIMAFRAPFIMNITTIENKTMDVMGSPQEMSQVNATTCYWDCVEEEYVALIDSEQLAAFGFKDTAPYGNYLAQEENFFPIIVPLNNSQVNVTAIAKILKQTIDMFYNEEGFMNYFNEFGWESSKNKIWFENTTKGYFMNYTYLPDGTLENGAGKVLINIEDDDWAIFEFSLKRQSSQYLNEEIEWSVNKGDTFYFGLDETEMKIDITGFNCSMYGIETIFGDEPIPVAFENVLANISIWNGENNKYELDKVNETIAYANDLYPFHPERIGSGFGLIPNNTKLKDLEFLGSVWEPNGVDVDIYDEVVMKFEAKDQGAEIILNIDNKTGIVKLHTLESEGELQHVFFRKNVTTLGVGPKVVPLWSDLVGVNKVTANVTMSGSSDLYYAVLPVNPLEPDCGRFPYEVPGLELYIDLYPSDPINIVNTNVNFTINYDEQPLIEADIDQSALNVYAFDLKGNSEWDVLDPSNYTVVPGTNTIHVHTKYMQYFSIGFQEVWNWSSEINVYDLMIYETLGNLDGPMPDIGDVKIPFISHSILNVTDIGLVNLTTDDIKQEVNQINASLMLWDPDYKRLVHDTEHGGIFPMSQYYYNLSRDPAFYIHPLEFLMGIPIVVPLRWDQLYLPEIARSLNESFYSSPDAREMGLPIWDNITVNSLTNSILFNNTSSDYFLEVFYHDNGTLMDAELFFTINISGEFVEFNLTCRQLSDDNTTDEVEWGVELGKSIYYGSNFPEGGPTVEMNITIVKFNQTTVWLADLFPFGEDAFMFNTWLTFENVWAELRYWNVTELEHGEQRGEWIYMDTTLIAAANNYFPFAPGDYFEELGLEGFSVPVLAPIGIDGYDLAEDFLDLMTLMLMMWTEGEIIATVTGVDDEYARIDLYAPSEPNYEGYMEWYLDNNTGITRLFYMYEELESESIIASIFKKNYTSVFNSDDELLMFDNALVPDVDVSVRIGNDYGYDYEFMEALLHKNPVNSSMPTGIGTPMFFTDIFFINHTSDRNAYNLTFYIELPSKYKVADVKYLAYYRYDVKNPENSKWGYERLEDIFEVVRYTSTNTIVLRITNLNGSLTTILAWMYSSPSSGGALAPAAGDDDDDDDDEAEVIPGYDIYLLLLAMSLISIVIVFERRKRIKF